MSSLRSSTVAIEIRPPTAKSRKLMELYELLGQAMTDEEQEEILMDVYDQEILTDLLQMLDDEDASHEAQRRERARMQDPRQATTLNLEMATALTLEPPSPARGVASELEGFSSSLPNSNCNAAAAAFPGSPAGGGAPAWNGPSSPSRGV